MEIGGRQGANEWGKVGWKGEKTSFSCVCAFFVVPL